MCDFDILNIILVIVTIIVSYFCFRYIYIALIINQLISKSNEINAILVKLNYEIKPQNIKEISNIIASSIQATQLLDYQKEKKHFLNLLYKRQDFMNQFYSILYTRVMLFFGPDYSNS